MLRELIEAARVVTAPVLAETALARAKDRLQRALDRGDRRAVKFWSRVVQHAKRHPRT